MELKTNETFLVPIQYCFDISVKVIECGGERLAGTSFVARTLQGELVYKEFSYQIHLKVGLVKVYFFHTFNITHAKSQWKSVVVNYKSIDIEYWYTHVIRNKVHILEALVA